MTTAILPPSREAMIGSQKGGGKKKRASSAKADSDSKLNQILDSKLPLSYESNIQRRFAPTLVTKDRNRWSLTPKSAFPACIKTAECDYCFPEAFNTMCLTQCILNNRQRFTDSRILVERAVCQPVEIRLF